MSVSWINQIILKAAKDPNFKAALINHPTQTVNHFLSDEGLDELADKVIVSVILETEKSVTIVLPANPEELTQEDLAAIAGGAPRVSLAKGLTDLSIKGWGYPSD